MKILQTLALAICVMLAPAQGVIITVMALTMLDMFTGIIAAKRCGQAITSKGLKRTVLKIMVYEVATIAAYFVGLYLTGPDLPVMKWVTGLIGLTELKSVLENLDAISGGSLFRTIVDKLALKLSAPGDEDK